MKTRVVFCADDLGVSAGVNEGIERAAAAGLVREVSLCVTGAAVESAASLARGLELGVGLHLSFSLGRSLTGWIRGLTDREGHFLPRSTVLASCLAHRPRRDEVEREVAAQLDRLEDLGVRASHLNGHHHVHVFPVIRDAVLAQARARGIRWIRAPHDDTPAEPRELPKRLLLSTLARRFRARARGAQNRLAFAGLGLHDTADYEARLLALLMRPPAPTFELMLHPRVEDSVMRRLDRLDARGGRWRAELEALTDSRVVRRVRELAVPVRFEDLSPTRPRGA